MTDIKICGVCDPADAAMATLAGAAIIGVILAPGRSRSRTEAQASAIFRETTAQRAGVFVDAGVDEVRRAAGRLGLDVIQLHGDEAPQVVERIRAGGTAAVWKAVRVRTAADVQRAAVAWAAADGLLLDGWSAAGHGGVGASFDWAAVAAVRDLLDGGLRIIVAGGLTAGNVGDVIPLLRPDVVDVSSGVEHAVGRKSPEQVSAFVAAVRGVKD
ncbi:MAG: phosphoribosylanthranilate isomerase [Gemmatimonadota bacterium]